MFTLDLSGLTTEAASLFNSLAPIAVIIGGLVVGIGLFDFILRTLKTLF